MLDSCQLIYRRDVIGLQKKTIFLAAGGSKLQEKRPPIQDTGVPVCWSAARPLSGSFGPWLVVWVVVLASTVILLLIV